MRIDRRLTFIGVMLVVLSMTMATQYATTKVSYTFGIVHPSNADIRFVGSDNSSDAAGRYCVSPTTRADHEMSLSALVIGCLTLTDIPTLIIRNYALYIIIIFSVVVKLFVSIQD